MHSRGIMKLGLIVFEPGSTPLLNLVKLLNGLSDEIYIISGRPMLESLKVFKKIYVINIYHKAGSNVFSRIINYTITQFKFLLNIIRICRKVNFFIFFIGGESLILPMTFLKLLRKKVILMTGGVATKVYIIKKDPLAKLLSLMVAFNMTLADKLIIYSPHILNECGWRRFLNKVIFSHRHSVDFTHFKIMKRISERRNIIGYVGRLSEEKGILNLIKAYPLVLEKSRTTLIVCGEGNLTNQIEKLVKIEGIEDYVKLMGWIPHQDLPKYLNEMRILVLPSFTEGLPNIILEAMACGTPVLATSVGAIPDMIKDGETGFLLRSNDPKYIAERIIELLNKPELLEKVSVNAYNFVRENFSYEKTLESWRRILNKLESKG
jgi:glycosyltransferase involved in cell wall biosynthesis